MSTAADPPASPPSPPAVVLADLFDAHEAELTLLALPWRSFGGRATFAGPIETLACFEDNTFVRTLLEGPGDGRVLVVDGGGSLRCALLGDMLGELAVKNGWSGVVVHGAIRDAAVMRTLPLGVMALGTCPIKSEKRKTGRPSDPVRIAGVGIRAGMWLYADDDGVAVSATRLGA
jgi:regulator of ribonuclease activity A